MGFAVAAGQIAAAAAAAAALVTMLSGEMRGHLPTGCGFVSAVRGRATAGRPVRSCHYAESDSCPLAAATSGPASCVDSDALGAPVLSVGTAGIAEKPKKDESVAKRMVKRTARPGLCRSPGLLGSAYCSEQGPTRAAMRAVTHPIMNRILTRVPLFTDSSR